MIIAYLSIMALQAAFTIQGWRATCDHALSMQKLSKPQNQY
jgi:hypothetical protein